MGILFWKIEYQNTRKSFIFYRIILKAPKFQGELLKYI